MANKLPVITIDGPSGTGKGTISLKLARHLEWHYLDSGALYRVLALAAAQNSIPMQDVTQLEQLSINLPVSFVECEDKGSIVYLNNQDVTNEIRSEECGENASKVAVIREVRAGLLKRQRAMLQVPGLIADGRDMGTIVFPDAILKIFLEASIEERANRRYLQLKEAGQNVNLQSIAGELKLRDARDRGREVAPMLPAKDAIILDTSKLSIDEVFDRIMGHLVSELN